MSFIGIKVFEDVEVDLALVRIKGVDKFAALLDPFPEKPFALGCSVSHVELPDIYEVANFAASPSSVALPIILSSGISR